MKITVVLNGIPEGKECGRSEGNKPRCKSLYGYQCGVWNTSCEIAGEEICRIVLKHPACLTACAEAEKKPGCETCGGE